MVSQTKETQSKGAIEKAQIDWPSTKTQMALAALLIIASCFVAYGSTFKIGFLADDYLHLDYAARASSGNFGPLFHNFISTWGGSEIMKSYSPLISLSFFIDYLLYHTHAFGYHLTNLMAFSGCSVMVALITLELTGRLGARSGALTALWAGLLFSVYPLHASSVAWVTGRADTLATAFYLASLFCFLRLELLKERGYLVRSMIFFVLALLSKETAVSLPVAVAFLACLPKRKVVISNSYTTATLDGWAQATGNALKQACLASLPYWSVLAAYALLRQAMLGTALFDSGGSGLSDLFDSLKAFGDKASLIKVFVPVNEGNMPLEVTYCLVPIVVVAVAFLARQLTLFARGEQKAALFFTPLVTIVWLALAILPAFQHWHIDPNLVGSSLFFLSSVGLCVTVALIALPSAEPVDKRVFSLFSVPALIALASLYLVWFYALQVNLASWQKASSLLENFESQLKATALGSGENKILVLNLPQDYRGAGMLGRKLYLDILNRPPFLGVDLSPRLIVLEPKTNGSSDFIWPSELVGLSNKLGPSNIYIWSNDGGTLKHFETQLYVKDKEQGHPDLAQLYTQELNKLPTLQAGHWQAVTKHQLVVRKLGNGWTELGLTDYGEELNDTESKFLIFWLPGVIDPRRPDNWLLSLDVEDEHGVDMASNCKVVWRNFASEELVGTEYPYVDRHHRQYHFYLGRNRSYLLSPDSLELGLAFKLAQGPVRFKPATLVLKTDDDADLIDGKTLSQPSQPRTTVP